MRKYTNFSDRASRQEFWLYTLAITLLSIIVSIIDPMISGVSWTESMDSFVTLSTILSIATFIPSLSVSVRRLHDINRSGWWLLIIFTLIGLIPLIYWNCKKSDEGENHFGVLNLNKD
ncbi:MAG: DUF805 domain-containing protein [Fidelibacterota bacterium]